MWRRANGAAPGASPGKEVEEAAGFTRSETRERGPETGALRGCEPLTVG